MAALVNALSYRLAVADRRSLRRDPVATSNPRASNLVVRAGWFDNNKDVDGRDPMYEQQQEILRRRRKGGNLESEVNKRRAKVSGFMKGTLAKEEMNAIKAKNKAKADELAKEAFKGQKGWISLPGMAIGMPEFDGGERFGDHSRAEIIQSVHGMSVECYAFVSIISVRGARYCAEAFAGDDKDVLSADFANGI